ncbi:CheR family methyltransferase [Massilia sp. DWR3-1-1]|uniref:CheR family methyltransferase n=1 Tax=Massilia sp. DWR3-1-1 TaxID=2804559 RepID=UPI003CEF3091
MNAAAIAHPGTAPSNGARARALLQQACGLQVSEAAAERAVRERLAARGVPDVFDGAGVGDYLDHLTGPELAALIELVVVPESWMYRDPDAFVAAATFVKARLAQRPQRQVRILSLPCAGGEEPYTMAMALSEAGIAADACRIDAMDLSSVALARARVGWYTRNAFRGHALGFRERHFSVAGNGYQIDAALRDQVTFVQANILTIDAAASAGRYDVIFCRNLLIYFDATTASAAAAVLRTLLADDGMLLGGYAEVPAFCANGFMPLRLPGAFALQKSAPAPAPLTASAEAPAGRARAGVPPRRAPPPARAPVTAPATLAPVAALLAQARRQADAGDYRGATTSCQALLDSAAPGLADQHAADAYYLLGLVADIERNSSAADDYWRRCVYLQPDHYEALCRLALLSELGGHAARAAVLRQRAARVFQRQQAHKGTP